MSRQRNPSGPMRPLVIRLSPDDRLTIELDARRRGMSGSALLLTRACPSMSCRPGPQNALQPCSTSTRTASSGFRAIGRCRCELRQTLPLSCWQALPGAVGG